MKQRLLDNLEPKRVFHYFENLTMIPRESGKEKAVADYLARFAADHGLSYHCDESWNVVIKKNAYPGYEDRPGIILQAHMDMVCEKNAEIEHDFEIDPLHLQVLDDRVTAVGTTLGADNGIGMALAMAILEDKEARHPQLEFLCTSDEERGMTGASNFDISQLKGHRMINLDADDEGVLIVGCAGGPCIQTEIRGDRLDTDSNWIPMRLEIKGLKGGHSGEDIHRNRANAIKLIGRLLAAVERISEIRLCWIKGGQKYNAIPREAEALILLPKERLEEARSAVEQMAEYFKKEYRVTDDSITAVAIFSGNSSHSTPFDGKTTKAVLDFINLCQNGIVRMDQELDGLVESSMSLGTVWTEDGNVAFQNLTRSSVESMYMEMYYDMQRLVQCVGGETTILSNCPEWSFDPGSSLRQICQDVYREMYGKDPKVSVLHAGLECGVFYKKAGRRLDMIAIGPDIRDLHAPGEYVVISSLQRFWEYLIQVLAK